MKPFNKIAASMALKGAKLIGPCGKMCSECAFRLNSPANLEPDNVLRALAALQDPNAIFNCHPKGSYGNAKKVCKGYIYAKAHIDDINRKLEDKGFKNIAHINYSK